jgi:hypothetical protein
MSRGRWRCAYTPTYHCERAAREYVDGFYHENIEPTENGFWVEAKDLREGDVFLGANGELSTLVAIDRVELDEPITVYNFTVEGNHNYFVIAVADENGQTSVLVHNAWYDPNRSWNDWWNSPEGGAMRTIIVTAGAGGLACPLQPVTLGVAAVVYEARPALGYLLEIQAATDLMDDLMTQIEKPRPAPQQNLEAWLAEQWQSQWNQLTPQQQHANQLWWDGLTPQQQQQVWQEWREQMIRKYPWQ